MSSGGLRFPGLVAGVVVVVATVFGGTSEADSSPRPLPDWYVEYCAEDFARQC